MRVPSCPRSTPWKVYQTVPGTLSWIASFIRGHVRPQSGPWKFDQSVPDISAAVPGAATGTPRRPAVLARIAYPREQRDVSTERDGANRHHLCGGRVVCALPGGSGRRPAQQVAARAERWPRHSSM